MIVASPTQRARSPRPTAPKNLATGPGPVRRDLRAAAGFVDRDAVARGLALDFVGRDEEEREAVALGADDRVAEDFDAAVLDAAVLEAAVLEGAVLDAAVLDADEADAGVAFEDDVRDADRVSVTADGVTAALDVRLRDELGRRLGADRVAEAPELDVAGAAAGLRVGVLDRLAMRSRLPVSHTNPGRPTRHACRGFRSATIGRTPPALTPTQRTL